MRYLLRRAGFYLVALWAAVTVNFILPRLMPGNPAQAYLAKIQSKTDNRALYAALLKEFGVDPNVPIWVQYWNYLGAMLRGQFGTSIYLWPQDVSKVLLTYLPWTIGLLTVAVTISFILGSLIGMVAAWNRGSWFDTVIPPLLTFFSAIPYFWMALALIFICTLYFDWIPTSDSFDFYSYTISWDPGFILSVIQHGFLPVVTLVIGSLAGWVLTMRNAMVSTLAEDYVLMARAKGLPERRTMFSYAARNAVLPSVTSFAISIGLVVSGALLTEIVFNYDGIGYILYQAINQNDYPLIQGCFLVIALTVLLANFLSELVYVFLDPRIRLGRS